jgi:hypothetical protein
MAGDLLRRVPGDEEVRHGGVPPVSGVVKRCVACEVNGHDVGPCFLEQAADLHGPGRFLAFACSAGSPLDGCPAAVIGLVDIRARCEQPLDFLNVSLEGRNVKRNFGVDLLLGWIIIRVVPFILEEDIERWQNGSVILLLDDWSRENGVFVRNRTELA